MVAIDRKRIREALRNAFTSEGLDPDWGEALGETETNLRPLSNLTGPDLARGGSYGPTQISRQTARAYGYAGAMEDLLSDPELAARLTASMVRQGFAERGGSLDGDDYVPNPNRESVLRFGPPASFRDMLSVWNAGRPYAQAPASTVSAYVPRGERFLAEIQAAA